MAIGTHKKVTILMAAIPNILSAQNLTIGYVDGKKETVITNKINLAFRKAQLIGLIGINGSGKSTLLRTLAGLQKPLSGSITLAEKPLVTTDPGDLAKTLSVVLTNQPISKNLSVAELVALGRQPYTGWLGVLSDLDKTEISSALSATNTAHLHTKKCYELSDGQLQRVLIARALAQQTDVILLDEPMTHLDLHHKASVLKLVSYMAHKKKKTVLFSTHDIEYALHICDTIIVMKDGKALCATPDILIKHGVMDSLFPSDKVIFDTVHKRFVLGK